MTRDYIWVDYTNYKGERGWRRCIPIDITCEKLPLHGPNTHWFMHVKMEDRGFARRSLLMTGIHQIKDGGPSQESYR